MNNNCENRIEELEKEIHFLRTILDTIHEGVYAINEKGEIILYNNQVEKIEGMKRSDVLGKTEQDAYSFSKESIFSASVRKKVLETGKPIVEQTYSYNLPDGRKINLISSTYPFFYQDCIAAVFTIGHSPLSVGDFISKTLEMQKKLLREENTEHTGAKYFLEDIIGNSDKLQEAVSLAKKIALNNSPVLVVGDTGTGKELFAQGIHNASLFSKGPFLPVNCAAIPDTLLESVLFGTVKGAFTGSVDIPGLFEQAENGTIFLDEINSMPFPLQAKLLRVLQEKVVRRIGSKAEIPINCRIISASNTDPFKAVNNEDEKIIRADLFFRLATVAISIPPLRDRKEDIEILTLHFIKKFNVKFGLFVKEISTDLLNIFEHYHWPGNVRELENIIESAMNFVEDKNKILKLNHLPSYFRERLCGHNPQYPVISVNKGNLRSTLLEVEKKIIQETLYKNNGNVSKAAEELGILRQNLHYKIRVFGLKRTKEK